jgi:CRP-like cAMP-binding protein
MTAESGFDAFSASSLCKDLQPDGVRQIFALAEPISFLAGTKLVRQGEPARGAWVLREGMVEARVTLPAGGEQTVATLGPGSYFGETALLEKGHCNASVVAIKNVDGWFIERESFRALAVSRNAAALAMQRTITATLAERLSMLNAALRAQPAPEDRPLSAPANIRHGAGAAVQFPKFLPILPFFNGFSPDEIDAVTAGLKALSVERGDAVFVACTPAASCYLVVRGAVEVVSQVDGRERRMALLGPGSLVGYLSVLAGRPHGAHAIAREQTTLLEIPAARFHALYGDGSGAAVKVQHAIHRALLQSLARSNSQLSRLVTQARLDASLKSQAAQIAV